MLLRLIALEWPICFTCRAILGYLDYRRAKLLTNCFNFTVDWLLYIFSGSSFTLDSAIPLSEDIRDHGGWIATCVATLMICISIYTMQLEIQIESSMEHNLRLALTKQQFELLSAPS